MTRTRTKLLIGAMALAGAVGYLGVTGARSGWVYYVDVDQFVRSAEAQARRARVHGVAASEGFDSRPTELCASFVLTGASRQLPVVYRGPVPDLFEAGRQVVIEGRMGPDGVFEADVLMTKCASKYEAMDAGAGGSP